MSAPHDDPRRLLEGDPAFTEIEAGLRRARERGPSAEQAARMRAALGLAPATGASSEPVVNEPAPAARFGWLKLIAGGALVIGAAVGIWHSSVRGPHLEPPIPREESMAKQPAPAQNAPLPTLAPAPALTAAPNADERGGAAGREAASTRAPRTPPRVNRVAPASDAPVDPAAELALLKRAKADARSAPAYALALIAEHEQRFPSGVLVEEREVIAIEALLVSGQRNAAEARAARFFARFPNSAHARRVHALLEDGSASQSDTKSSAAPHP